MKTNYSVLLFTSHFFVITTAAADQDAKGIAFFESKVRPLLIKQCYECHSAEKKQKGGLVLDQRAGWETGGDSGPAIVPGDLKKSLVIEAIHHGDPDLAMPPKKKLSDSEIAILEEWVTMGAPDPRDGKVAETSPKIDLKAGRQFWSFQPISKPTPPTVKDTSWPRTDVDRFILARLESEGLKRVPDADPRTLIRRASLDLTGLPPSPEEVEAFVEASNRSHTTHESNKTYEALIDRFLSSKAFGERWGRHWLDVARYAESTGVNWNIPYPLAWRYRDYVIAAFNADKPYDSFLHEQIAGDLLPFQNDAQRNEQLIATGFLAIGLKDLQALTPKVYQMDIVDEQIATLSRATMALSVDCARCHDHKFDPIRTEDYYALAGIFTSTEPLSGVMRLKKNDLPGTRLASLAGVPDSMPEKQRDDLILATYSAVKLSLTLRDKLQVLDKAKQEGKPNVPDLERETAALAAKQEAELAKFEALNIQDHDSLRGKTMSVRDAKPADCPVFIRGESDKPGKLVPRGVPAVLTSTEAFPIANGQSGRLELARWLTSPQHPLTARVMVNRVWLHLLGAGIVESVDDFGKTGQPPSHPELLDHLAQRFIENGWSVKQLIREIMLSRVYQLASTHDAAAHEKDAANRLLWRANRVRLDADALRDTMLHVGGRLDLTPPHGSPVQPIANQVEFYNVKGLFNPVVLNRVNLRGPDDPAPPKALIGTMKEPSHARGLLQRDYRFRSVYLPTIRGGKTEVRAYFDGAATEEVVGKRTVTTVPTQSLFLMNSPFAVDCASALAKRITGVASNPAERIELAFKLTLNRPPTADEASQITAYLTDYPNLPSKEDTVHDSDLAWVSFCQTLISCAEFRYRY